MEDPFGKAGTRCGPTDREQLRCGAGDHVERPHVGGDEEILRTKGYGDLLDPNTEDPPRRMLTQAELQAWLDNGDPSFKMNNLKLTLETGRQGSLERLFETTRGVGTKLDFVPFLSADNSSVQLLLIYGMGGVNETGSAQSPTVPHPFYQFP